MPTTGDARRPLRMVVQDRRQRLQDELAAAHGVTITGQAADAAGLLAACRGPRPDVIVLDVDAEGWDGVRLASALRKLHGRPVVVGVADEITTALTARARRAGIAGVLSPDASHHQVLATVAEARRNPEARRRAAVRG